MLGLLFGCEVAVGFLDLLPQLLFSVQTANRASGGDTDDVF